MPTRRRDELSREQKRDLRRSFFKKYRQHQREHGPDCDITECIEEVVDEMRAEYAEGKFGAIPWELLFPFVELLIERVCPPERS